jgi:TM2 domain-containing membrane protein YozV
MLKNCPTCGHRLEYEQAEICPKCGVRIRAPPSQQSSGQKSPGIAALCSVFIPGLGQVYNGELEKGIGIYIAELIGWALTISVSFYLFFLFPIIWIYGIYDAYTTANRMNSNIIPVRSSGTSTMVLYIIGVFAVGFILSSMLMPVMLGGLAKSGTSGTGGTDNPLVGKWKWINKHDTGYYGIDTAIADDRGLIFYSDGSAKFLPNIFITNKFTAGTWDELDKGKTYQISWEDGSTESLEMNGWPNEYIKSESGRRYYRLS